MKNIKTMEEIEEYLNDLKNYNTKDVEKFNSKDFKIIKYRYNTNGTLDIWENVKRYYSISNPICKVKIKLS